MDKKLGFGLMRLPLKDLKDHKSIDMDELKEMVEKRDSHILILGIPIMKE